MVLRIFPVVLAICTLTFSCSIRQSEASSVSADHDIIVYPIAATAVRSQSYLVEVNQAGVFTEKYKDL